MDHIESCQDQECKKKHCPQTKQYIRFSQLQFYSLHKRLIRHVTKCDEKICPLCQPMKEKYYDLAYTEARKNARDLLNALRSDQIF